MRPASRRPRESGSRDSICSAGGIPVPFPPSRPPRDQRFHLRHVCRHADVLPLRAIWPGSVAAGTLSKVETRELVLLSCSEEFSALVEACRRMPVPQMRIGSFVMLCFDCGTLLPRGRVERAGGTERCRVHIFDWDARSLTLRVRTRSSGKAAKTTGHSTGLLLLRGCRAAARLLQSLRGQILTEEAQPSPHTLGQGPLPGRQVIGTRIVHIWRKLVPTGMGSHTSKSVVRSRPAAWVSWVPWRPRIR